MTDAPWLFVLVAAGTFQIGRGAPIEGAPFVLGAVALAADELGWLPARDVVAGRPSAPGWVVAITVAASAAIIGIAPESGWLAGVLVAATGVAAVRPTWGRREPGFSPAATERRSIRHAAAWWAAIAIALCLWELASFALGLPSARADWEHPALSDLVKPAIDAPLARTVLFAAWVLAGWTLVRRGWGERADGCRDAGPHRDASAAADGGGGASTSTGTNDRTVGGELS